MNTAARNIFEFTKKNVFVFTLIASLSTVYFPVYNLWGIELGLKNKENLLTIFGGIISGLILVLSFSIVLLRALGEKYDSKLRANAFEIMEKLLRTANSLRDVKYQYYKNLSEKDHGSLCENIGVEQQVYKSILSFRDSIADLIGISDDDIGISVIYRTQEDEEFRIINTPNIEDDLDHKLILNNEKSTLGYLIKNNKAIVFIADKRYGKLKGRYLISPKDSEGKYKGSIVCRNISLRQNGKRIVEAYLSISTYGYQICEESDFESKKKFAKYFMPILVKAIKIEFSKEYIRKYSKCEYRRKAI